MGIPGLLKEIGKGERVALAKLAVDHFEKHQRPLRVAIDAAIWNFQTQSGQGGKNPALRTLFYRLLRLLALPINPVFVYDGKNKPLTKRGKTVSRYGTCVSNEMSKTLVARFQFPHHTAPGEAEAECAFLQKNGIVDAVMSQDVDAIMFGSTLTLRDWSKEGTKGNKAPTHVNVFEGARVKGICGLDPSGMVLVALLSGGDYHDGVQGFGPGLSCQIAKAGFGEELITIIQKEDEQSLRDWRERLQYELETNESGYFLKRHKTVKIPEDFPDRTTLGYYVSPAVSKQEDLPKLETRWLQWWAREIDVLALREYTAMTFDWLYKGGARKYIRCLAQPLFQHRLKERQIESGGYSFQDITEKRKHFVNDGISELRFTAVPATIVGIDLKAEEENPEFADIEMDEDWEGDDIVTRDTSVSLIDELSSPSKRRKRPPWDPYKAEKWWIPELLLNVGLPNVVKGWHQEWLDIRADPLRFATRKCKPPAKAKPGKTIDHSMKHGALENFLPASTTGGASTQTRVKQSLERAKTDTILLRSSQQGDVGKYFKPSKSSKPVSFVPAGSKSEVLTDAVPSAADDSDDGFDIDLLDLLQKPSKSTQPWLTRAKNDHDFANAATSPSVTHRKKRAPKPPHDEEDDIIYVSTKRLSAPTMSSPAAERGLKFQNMHGRQHSMISEVPAISWQEPETGGRFAAPVLGGSLLWYGAEGHRKSIGFEDVADSHQPAKDRYGELGPTPQVFASEPKPRKPIKKMAMLRESLPGTWKEVPLTPSQSLGIAFVDLTDT